MTPFIFETNGACLLVADKSEISDARDHLTVPLETPLELFGEVSLHRCGRNSVFPLFLADFYILIIITEYRKNRAFRTH